MFENYFKTTWRNLIRYKGFTLLNVLGLTLGLVFTLLIGLWVQDELSINQFHYDIDQLYQARANLYWSEDGPLHVSTLPRPMEQTIKNEVPEVAMVTQFEFYRDGLLSVGKNASRADGVAASSNFLQLFSFPLLSGNTKSALSDPSSIVISEKLALQFFGTTAVIGKTITVNEQQSFQVSGVLKNVSRQSSIQFDWVCALPDSENENDWGNFSYQTYIRLNPQAKLDRVQQKIKQIGQLKNNKAEVLLQPFAEAYLYSKFENGKATGGRIEYVRLFSIIALFVLFLACINFTNLATARAAQRAREIGIRKAIGAGRIAIALQFLGESIVIALGAAVVAIGITQLALPRVNVLFEKQLHIPYLNPGFWAAVLMLFVGTGILAGAYPALYLSGFRPIKVLKGELFSSADGAAVLRKGLVVFQFVLAIGLMTCVIIVQQQIHFIKTTHLGIDRKDLFYTILDGKNNQQQETIRQELLNVPGIAGVTTLSHNPMDITQASGDLQWPGKNPAHATPVSPLLVGKDFIKTMGIRLVEGRDFQNYPADSANYIVNEAAVKMMGLENPLGTEIEFWKGKGRIIGIVEDFHLKSLHENITPLVVGYAPKDAWMLWIKPTPGQTEMALAQAEKVLKSLNPGYPFEYQFADDEFNQQYRTETLTGQLANWFALASLLISCLGLFGLATYATVRRTKEIGIRKVLGASLTSVVGILSRDFIFPVLIACLLAFPLAGYLMSQWLQDFAYRIHIQWWMFALAGVLALGIAFLTIGFQSIKAALANPVKSLRSE